MKKLFGSVAALALLVGAAYALEPTKTAPVAPESGEFSQRAAEIVNMARIKPGMCTATIAVTASAGAGTCNGASGVLSVTAATAGASGATPSVLTVTNSKVDVGDFVLCAIDRTGATAAAVLTCNASITADNTIAISIYDAGTVALASSTVKVYFLVLTAGNPN